MKLTPENVKELVTRPDSLHMVVPMVLSPANHALKIEQRLPSPKGATHSMHCIIGRLDLPERPLDTYGVAVIRRQEGDVALLIAHNVWPTYHAGGCDYEWTIGGANWQARILSGSDKRIVLDATQLIAPLT